MEEKDTKYNDGGSFETTIWSELSKDRKRAYESG